MSSEGDAFLHFVTLAGKSTAQAVFWFVWLTEHALQPTGESPKAAGFDLRSTYDAIVPARGKELIHTDLKYSSQKDVMVR
jgi:dUTPase